MTVGKKTLTITADDKTIKYGDATPSFTFTYSGWVYGESTSALGTLPTATTTYTRNSNVNTYPITPSGAVSSDKYSFNYVAGTLTVRKVAASELTIGNVTVSNTYSSTFWTYSLTKNSSTSYTYTQVYNEHPTTFSNVTISYNLTGVTDFSQTLSPSSASITDVGTYEITYSYSANSNFAPVAITVIASITDIYKLDDGTNSWGYAEIGSAWNSETTGTAIANETQLNNWLNNNNASSHAYLTTNITITAGKQNSYTLAGTLDLNGKTITITFAASLNIAGSISPRSNFSTAPSL